MSRYKYIKDGDLIFAYDTKRSKLFSLYEGKFIECAFGIIQLSKFFPFAEEYAESDNLEIIRK